jgi:hypothetical protein
VYLLGQEPDPNASAAGKHVLTQSFVQHGILKRRSLQIHLCHSDVQELATVSDGHL